MNSYKPTKARAVPMKFERFDGFSAMNASQTKQKFAYIKLNSQTPPVTLALLPKLYAKADPG